MLSRAKVAAERLLELLDKGLDQPVIGKTVIRVVADDNVVKHLYHEELAGPHEVSGQFSIFRRGRRIA